MTKRVILPVAGAALVILTISIWFGGRQRWELIGIGPATNSSPSLTSRVEEQLEENPENIILKYNLAHFYYQQERYTEAENLLAEIRGTPGIDQDLAEKAIYNLGNVLVRISETTENPEKALSLLRQSLQQYRRVLDSSRERQQYTGSHVERDEDAAFNHALVKRRIKILADQIARQQKEEQQKKELFVLLKELLEKEKQIKTELEAMSSMKNREQRQEKRLGLLNRQAENLKHLEVVKERIMEMITPGKQAGASTAPTI